MEREKKDEFRGRKRREKELFGEDHVWLGFEAERVDPSGMSEAAERVKNNNKKVEILRNFSDV